MRFHCAISLARTACLAGVCGVLATNAHAGWTVTILHQENYGSSTCASAYDHVQAGRAFEQACQWSGTAQSRIFLHPPGAQESLITQSRSGKHVGTVTTGGLRRVALWTGTNTAWVNLSPAGFTDGYPFALAGDQQVGVVYLGSSGFAALWRGTSQSFINMTPPNALASAVFATDGVHQVGYARFDTTTNAILWSGTAASWQIINPPGTSASEAWGIDGDSVVMQVSVPVGSPGSSGAALWHLSTNQLTHLHPAGANPSSVRGVFGGFQVGWVTNPSNSRSSACIWRGSAATYEDLQQFMPPFWIDTQALNVWHDNTTLFVAGTGRYNSVTAVLWTRPLSDYQSCDSIDFNGDGVSPDSGDIDDFLSVFGGGACSNAPNCGDIDFNNDGVSPDSDDIDALLRVFGGGSC